MASAIGSAGVALAATAVVPSVALGHGAGAPVPTFPQVLWQWSFEPVVLAGVAVAGIGYWLAVRRIGIGHPDNAHPRWRSLAFGLGLVAILLALSSPVEVYADQLLSIHMVQHLLLQLVAAPLLLLGAPATLTLRVAGPSVRRWLLRILHSRVVAALSFPLLGWVAFAAVNWGWHLSPLYDQALEEPWLHYVQHATMLGAALLFWWPVVAADPARWRLPEPARLFYLFLAMPQNSFLGVAILSAPAALYPHYAEMVRAWGPTPLEDQSLAGLIMWAVGDVCFLLGMGAVAVAWLRRDERRGRLEDARLDAMWAARERERQTEEPPAVS